MRPLTPKQKAFVGEYLVDLNATQAAIRAGYSAKRADAIGHENLRKPEISVKVQAAMAARGERTQVDSDYVLKRLVEIDQMDCLDILTDEGAIRPVRDWPKIWRQFICGFDISDLFEGQGDERKLVGLLKKIKWPDKVKNLELIGRHVDVQAFKDKTQIQGDPDSPLVIKFTQEDARI